MAPEQLAGSQATVRSDLYALGLMLHEFVTGKRPFDKRRREGEEPLPPSCRIDGVDPSLERIILRCLAWDPGARPASAEAVEMALLDDEELEMGTCLRAVIASAGDVAWDAALIESHRGREIATPDGPVWLFERPWGAVSFALAIQEGAAARLGIHLGEVSLRQARGEGPAVTMALKLAELARASPPP